MIAPPIIKTSDKVPVKAMDTSNGLPAGASQEMSFEEFMTSYEGSWAEWVDGKVIEMPPPGSKHQRISMFLARLLGDFVEIRKVGELLAAPFLMRIPGMNRGREPDLLFLSTAHADRVTRTHLNGPADLVVEIISPESVGRDRGEKFVEYEAAGIPEYWLIDPDRKRAEFYVLDDHGRYHDAGVDDEGRYHSRILAGLWVEPGWFWQEPLPPVLDLLREIGVI